MEELEYLIFELPSSIKISLLSVESVFVAGMTKFRLNKNALHIFYGSMDYKYLNEFPGALKFLYNHEINNAKNKGYRYFNFGVDVHHGEKPNINLRNFKLGFGGKITTRDSYFKDL